MMPLRTLAGVAAGVALSAFALGAARLGPAIPAAPEDPATPARPAVAGAPAATPPAVVHAPPPARPRPALVVARPAGPAAAAPTPAVARGRAAKAAPVPATLSRPVAARFRDSRTGREHRARVAAGVLARAASLRAQGREAACAVPEEAAPAPGSASVIESVEIDWNAGPREP